MDEREPCGGKDYGVAQARRILVVDDDASARRLLRLTLEHEGYEVSEASDGGEALALVRSDVPDLVLLDITMPKKTGWDLLSELRGDAKLSGTTVVMLTGQADEASERRARDLGAAAYVAKPVGMDDLVRALDRALGAAEQRRRTQYGA
jgi:CheY-like chemotaxis protein